MYAVISSGGKQYGVVLGDLIKLESLPAEVGEVVEFPVLLVDGELGLKVGTPYLEGVKVKASVIEQGLHDKVKIIKFRRRKHHLKRMGHRQRYTAVRVTEIVEG